MKQLLHRIDNGELRLVDTPVPAAQGVNLLVEARASVISPGTERMVIELGRANLLQKARSRPDQVKQVIDKVRTDGLAATVGAVRSRLEAPITLGYCSAGVVVQTGPGASGFAAGDRVVTNGPHAEYVCVPHTLAARIPANVDFAAAAVTPLAAIALQGIRMAAPTLGETVVVYGVGAIGLLAVQLLRINGCRVLAIDRDDSRLELARQFGATVIDGRAGDSVTRVMSQTGGVGADAVLLTLASSSDEPVHEAAAMSRRRGRIILVGVTGLQLRRDDFYKKELTFAVSCSYGPGRYDPAYETEGHDYPVGFVRWTEQRNFEAVLALMADGSLDVQPLITHRFPFGRILEAYEVVTGAEPALCVLIEYPNGSGAPPVAAEHTISVRPAGGVAVLQSGRGGGRGQGIAAVVGAGVFAQRTLIPAIRKAGFRLRTIVSDKGTSATVAAERFGFEQASTDFDSILADESVDTVFVLTRHDSHASLAVRALESGRNVFVEKPLALTYEDLAAVEAAARTAGGLLTVGFNRRHAPLTQQLIQATRRRAGPASLIITVNAGPIPADHWTQHPEQGGGRIIGEACHFVDLCRAIIGFPIESAHCTSARGPDGRVVDDITHISLTFADGSTGVIHYLASGARSFPKERVEVFVDGSTYVIENWLKLRRYNAPRGVIGHGRSNLLGRHTQDKGHLAQVEAWHAAICTGGPPPIPPDEVLEVSRWSLRLAELARRNSAHAS